MASAEQKHDVIARFKQQATDSGSPDIQFALLSGRIAHLTGHFRTNAKDHQTRRGLLKMVGQRRRLLSYLKKTNIDRYRTVTKELGLRK